MTRRSTGFPAADAQDDFLRERRRHLLTRMGQRLRFAPDDAGSALSYDRVVNGLGVVSEHAEGLQTIPLDAIVGSVDKSGDYDRQFRPRSDLLRERWQRIAVAQRRGESVPPIDVYRVGDTYFVKDGHHRVSVARALGKRTIDAYVTSVKTAAPHPRPDDHRTPARPLDAVRRLPAHLRDGLRSPLPDRVRAALCGRLGAGHRDPPRRSR